MKNVTAKQMELREYDLIGILDDEIDAVESLLNDYDGSTHVCDAITEIADNFIPTYNSDVWENAADIRDYIEEAVDNGLVDTSNFDLIATFQAGYYEYYSQSLNANTEHVLFNYVANLVNEFLEGLTPEQSEQIDMDELEMRINSNLDEYDNNSYFSDLEDYAAEIVEELEEELAEEEEE
jgi:hypothetical protein